MRTRAGLLFFQEKNIVLHKRVSSKCTLFVLEAARRGDEGCSGLVGAGGVGVQLQKFNNKNYRKSLRCNVIHAIIESKDRHGRYYQRSHDLPIGRERVRPTYAGSARHRLVGRTRKEKDQ